LLFNIVEKSVLHFPK